MHLIYILPVDIFEITPEQQRELEEEARLSRQKWEELKKWREEMGKWLEENRIPIEDEDPKSGPHHKR